MNRSIIPAILTDSVADLQHKLDLAKGFCNRIGVDIIDGEFADNLTISPEDLQGADWHSIEREAQLMVTEPVDYLGLLHTAGFKRVYGHIERMGSMEGFVEECVYLKMESGFALDLYTPIESIPDDLLHKTDGVLLMSVKAGFSNQEYKNISSKIKDLLRRGFGGDIQIDGGMNINTIPGLIKLGANQFSVTSAIWNTADPSLSYRELTDIL